MRSRLVARYKVFGLLIIVAGVAAACGSNPSTGTTSQGSTSRPPATKAASTPAHSPTLSEQVDEIMAGIDAASQGDAVDPTTLRLPTTLTSYMTSRSLLVPRVQKTNPVVKMACDMAGAPKASEVVEGLLSAVLQKLRINKSLKGIGVLVSAIDIGCKLMVPILNDRIQIIDPLPLPTPAPTVKPRATPRVTLPPQIRVAALGEAVTVAESRINVLDITVVDVQCASVLGDLAALPGDRFIGVDVSIMGLRAGEEVDPYYWSVDVDGDKPGLLIYNGSNTWSPPFGYGVLSRGAVMSGWLTYVVPAPAKSIVVTYRGNPYTAVPVFKVNRGTCSSS